MRHLFAAILMMLLFAAITTEGRAQPPQTGPGKAAFRKGFAGPGKQRPMPRAEWLDPDHGAPNGTQYQTFFSKVLGRDVSYLLYLPPGYARQADQRYPVIYWLHGMGGNQRAGAAVFVPQVDAAIKQGTLPPAIVVLVNGMVTSFYCDSEDGKTPMESVIIKDLIPHIDQTWRTIPRRGGRLIQGFSMGGYGAAHLGFKYPELFGAVVVDSGALLLPDAPNPNGGGPMQGVFGTNSERRRTEHPYALARKNADKLRNQTRIHIGVGSLDSLLPRNQELHELLQKLNIEHQYGVVPGVAHSSPDYYQKLGTQCLEFHRKSMETLNRQAAGFQRKSNP